jgi:hypothetical protein
MRTFRFRTAVLGVLVATCLGLVVTPSASAAPTALPTCTSWSTYYAAGTTNYVVHVPTLGRGTFNRNCSLRQGDRNDAVKVLQRALRWCLGDIDVEVDGQYGPITRGAVLDLQQWVNDNQGGNLQEDGEYGPATAAYLPFPVWTYPGNVMMSWCE